jgi:hypothetical protein
MGCAALAALAIALGGCSSGQSGDSDATPGADGYTLSEAELEASLKSAGTNERQYLEDGAVTFSDYEAAFLNFVSCAEARGVSFGEGPKLTARRKMLGAGCWWAEPS